MITTFRAALAVTLLACFYLLAAGFIAAAAALDFSAVTHLDAAAIKAVVAVNVGALIGRSARTPGCSGYGPGSVSCTSACRCS